jgi:dihydroneopterin aldolase
MSPPYSGDERSRLRRVFVHDLVLDASIGVYKHEKRATQPVRISVDLAVDEGPVGDDVRNVVDYQKVIDGIAGIVDTGHINLVETLAERIAAMCLADRRVASARVRIEKLNAAPEGATVGVEIERVRG